MSSTAFTLRLKGDVAALVDELMRRGYSESKTELVRTSLITYGMQLGLFPPKKLHKRVLSKMKASGKKYSDREIREQISKLE